MHCAAGALPDESCPMNTVAPPANMHALLADVRRAHRLVVAYNRRLLDLLRLTADALQDDHPELTHLGWSSYPFTKLQPKHDPTAGKWAWDFTPLAFADVYWGTAAKPQAGAILVGVRHTLDTGLVKDGKREPDPVSMEPTETTSTVLLPAFIAIREHRSEWTDWDVLFGEAEEGTRYQGWGDGKVHQWRADGGRLAYGGLELEVAELATVEAVRERLIEPLRRMLREAEAS